MQCKDSQDATATQLLPNEEEIITLIEKAKSDLIKDMSSLDIDTSQLDFKCHVQPTKFHTEFHYEDIDDDDDEDDFGRS